MKKIGVLILFFLLFSELKAQKDLTSDLKLRWEAIHKLDAVTENHLKTSPAEAIPQETIKQLIQSLDDKDGSVRSQGTEILKKYIRYSEVLTSVYRSLQTNKSARAQYFLIEIMGESKSHLSVDLLLLRLKNKNHYIQGAAASSLGKLQDSKAIEPLIELLQDKSCHHYARIFAAEALTQFEDLAIVEALSSQTQDSDHWVRYAVAKALGEMPERNVSFPLRELAQDSHRETREIAQKALAKLGKRGKLEQHEKTVLEETSSKLLIRIDPIYRKVSTSADFEVEVKNQNPEKLKNLWVTHKIPAGMSYLNSSPRADFSSELKILTWKIDSISPSEKYLIRFSLKPERRGQIIPHSVHLIYGKTIQTSVSRVVVQSVPVFHLQGYETDDPVEVGKNTIYFFEARNEGTSTVTNIQMEILIPEEMVLVEAEGPTNYQAFSRGVIFSRFAALPVGEKLVYKVNCQVVKNNKNGGARARATITCDQRSEAIIDEEGTSLMEKKE